MIQLSRARAGARAFFDAIGPVAYPAMASEQTPAVANLSVIAFLCVDAAVSLLLIALGQGAGRYREPTLASVYFWSGVTLLIIPFVSRITQPIVARGERLVLLLLLGESFLLYTRLYSPTGFAGYDEYLHWVTAHDILYRHNLFLDNSLIPVSPFYPALEIVTAAIANLAALTVFPAAWVVLAFLRAMFITSLFLFIESITHSTRVAAIAGLVYMSASTFVIFHAAFSYESMGVVLVVFVMWAETKINLELGFRSLILPVAGLASLAVTHHASAMLAVSYLIGITIFETVRWQAVIKFRLAGVAAIAIVAFGFVVLWEAIPDNPVSNYLSSAVFREVRALLMVISGNTAAHMPFVTDSNGQTQPILLRLIAVGGVIVISLCLATGFFRTLAWGRFESGWWRLLSLGRRQWLDSRIVLLAIGALGFPVLFLFRLSNGWEIGDRMATWVYISVGLVVAIAVIYYWESRWKRLGTIFIGTILLGGTILGSGSHPIRVPYMVAADDASIESMGIEAARWTKEWLGPGNRFGANRDNQLLLATYGDQDIATNLAKKFQVDVSYAFLDPTIDHNAITVIKDGRVGYLEVDLRDSTELPVLGGYFWEGEGMRQPGGRRKPPSVATLLKYDKRPDAGRIFDNGYIVIYDVGRLHDDQ